MERTERVLVVDGGSCDIKIGLVSPDTHSKPSTIQNRIWQSKSDRSRVLFGHPPSNGDGEEGEEGGRGDFLSYSPTSNGCVVDWDIEASIWSTFFGSVSAAGAAPPEHKKAKPSTPESFEGLSLLCTEPALCPATLRRAAYQTYFESMGFAAVRVDLAETLSLRNFFAKNAGTRQLRRTAVVVDVGHSGTRVVPYVVGDNVLRPVTRGIRRVDVGGEVLTDLYARGARISDLDSACKEKEEFGYVSLDFAAELARCDGVPANFRVPEALFTPSDYGINQCGIVDATAQAIGMLEPFNPSGTFILVRGGSARFKNFIERFSADLKMLLPEGCSNTISISEE